MEIPHPKGGLKCDIRECDKRAIINIQSGRAYYPIGRTGRYGKQSEFQPDDETNEHRCEEHQYD